jgi:hypothetical protein
MQFGGRRASTATEKDIGREEKTKTVGMVVFVIHTRGTERCRDCVCDSKLLRLLHRSFCFFTLRSRWVSTYNSFTNCSLPASFPAGFAPGEQLRLFL